MRGSIAICHLYQESTAENGYSVYSLQRPTFARTGVF